MSNSKTLQDVFSKYTPKNDFQRRILSSSFSVRTRVDRESRYIEVTAEMCEFVSARELFNLCDDIKNAYQVNFVKIKPQYKKEWFSQKVMDSIFFEASLKGAITRGFFNEYTVKISEHEIDVTISTTNGGIDLIYLSEAPYIISDIIFEQFGLRYTITIQRDSYSDDAASLYDEHQKKWLNEQREIARRAISDAEAAANAPAPKNKDELLDEYKNKMTTLYDDEPFCEKDGDNFSIGKMFFDASSTEVIYGEEFTPSDPVPLRNIKGEYKNICVFGEIFGIDQRETRNKAKRNE